MDMDTAYGYKLHLNNDLNKAAYSVYEFDSNVIFYKIQLFRLVRLVTVFLLKLFDLISYSNKKRFCFLLRFFKAFENVHAN